MEERSDALVPHPVDPREHPFAVNNEKRNSMPKLLPWAMKSNRCWCLERACVRRHPSNHNSDVEQNSEAGEGDQGVCDRGIDGPHVSTQSAGEEEEGNLQHNWETLDEQV